MPFLPVTPQTRLKRIDNHHSMKDHSLRQIVRHRYRRLGIFNGRVKRAMSLSFSKDTADAVGKPALRVAQHYRKRQRKKETSEHGTETRMEDSFFLTSYSRRNRVMPASYPEDWDQCAVGGALVSPPRPCCASFRNGLQASSSSRLVGAPFRIPPFHPRIRWTPRRKWNGGLPVT